MDPHEERRDGNGAEHHPQAPGDEQVTPLLNIVSHTASAVKLNGFMGKESWRVYRRQFERVALMNGWQDQMLNYLLDPPRRRSSGVC